MIHTKQQLDRVNEANIILKEATNGFTGNNIKLHGKDKTKHQLSLANVDNIQETINNNLSKANKKLDEILKNDFNDKRQFDLGALDGYLSQNKNNFLNNKQKKLISNFAKFSDGWLKSSIVSGWGKTSTKAALVAANVVAGGVSGFFNKATRGLIGTTNIDSNIITNLLDHSLEFLGIFVKHSAILINELNAELSKDKPDEKKVKKLCALIENISTKLFKNDLFKYDLIDSTAAKPVSQGVMLQKILPFLNKNQNDITALLTFLFKSKNKNIDDIFKDIELARIITSLLGNNTSNKKELSDFLEYIFPVDTKDKTINDANQSMMNQVIRAVTAIKAIIKTKDDINDESKIEDI